MVKNANAAVSQPDGVPCSVRVQSPHTTPPGTSSDRKWPVTTDLLSGDRLDKSVTTLCEHLYMAEACMQFHIWWISYVFRSKVQVLCLISSFSRVNVFICGGALEDAPPTSREFGRSSLRLATSET